ncbi:MAG: hypothetical protein ACTHW1_09825, partial [Ancrocorticia sp.]
SQLSQNTRMKRISEWAGKQASTSKGERAHDLEGLRRRAEGRVIAQALISGEAYFWVLWVLALPVVLLLDYFWILQSENQAARWLSDYGLLWVCVFGVVFFPFAFTAAVETAQARKQAVKAHVEGTAVTRVSLSPLSLKDYYGFKEIAFALLWSLASVLLAVALWLLMPWIAGSSLKVSIFGSILLVVSGILILHLILDSISATRLYPTNELTYDDTGRD